MDDTDIRDDERLYGEMDFNVWTSVKWIYAVKDNSDCNGCR